MRNYSREEINSATNDVVYADRKTLLTEKNKAVTPPLVYKLVYTPHIKTMHLKRALIKNWHLITQNPQLHKLFPEQPIIAYKRSKNLKDFLVKSRFTSSRENEVQISDDTFFDALLEAIMNI